MQLLFSLSERLFPQSSNAISAGRLRAQIALAVIELPGMGRSL
jgi:hypothetical protein